MTVFVDTAGFYAVQSVSDANHLRADAHWRRMIADGTPLVTSNYLVVETVALLQNLGGFEQGRAFLDTVVPAVQIVWLDAATHQAAVEEWAAAHLRQLSLVDCSSFTLMRRHGLQTVFTFDRHFATFGFTIVP